ncbi:MAG: hypothetical protein P4K83_07040 [Terracidiphilus sp.]|nr:hypothetical protein [Terracidiphilus sp.]
MVVIPFLIPLVNLVKRKIALPWFKEAQHEVLDLLRDAGFSRSPYKGTPLDHHRITLFRYQRFCWKRWPFFDAFLVPKLRSNHLTQKMDVVFRCPDTGESVEGIAGRAFRTGDTVSVVGLPDASSGDISESDIQEYADSTFVSADWVRENQPHARSYMGIPIRIGGRISWVLVVDSREANSEVALNRIAKRYSILFNPFMRFLENMP